MSHYQNTKEEEGFLNVTVFQQCRAQGKFTLSPHRCLSPTVLPTPWEQHCFYSCPSPRPLFLQDARHTSRQGLCTCWSLCLERSTPEIHGPYPSSGFFFFHLNVTFPMRSFSHMIYLSALLSFSPLHWTLMEHTVYVTNSSTFLYVPHKDKLHEDRDFSPLYPQHLGYRGHAIV